MSVKQTSPSIHFDPSVYEAAKQESFSEIQRFILGGGWVDMPDAKGNSMLYYAGKHGCGKVISLLKNAGAHSYPNLNGKTVLDKAAVEVKASIAHMQSESLDRLINTHLNQFTSPEEAIQFLLAIQPQHYRIQALRDYAEYSAFVFPKQASLVIDHLEENTTVEGNIRSQVVRKLVHISLSCGDISSAQTYLEKLPPTEEAYQKLELQIEIFSRCFEEMESHVQNDPSAFPEVIKQGLEISNFVYQLPEQKVRLLIEGMSEARSYKGALMYANTLKDPKMRGLARCGLSHCGLKHVADAANKAAEKKLKELSQRVQTQVV